MSKVQTLRALVNERLVAAAEEIFALFERTIAEYEEELFGCGEENRRTPPLQDSPPGPRIVLVRGGIQLKQESTQSPCPSSLIKEEQSIKQEEEQLPVHVPDSDAVCVKTKETSLLQQRQSEHQEKTQGEDISSETEGHFPDTGNDHDCGAPVSCSATQMETETDDQSNQVQVRDAQNLSGPSPEHSSAPENNGDTPGSNAEAEEKKHQCYVCQKRFRSKQVLNRHNKIHTVEKLYTCPICNKTCVQKYNLEVHMRTHTGEKPFSCLLCGKKFCDPSNLKTHIRITHMGDTPFSCPFCEKSFCFVSDLKAHIRTHTGERPFSCSICKKAYTWNSSLNKHMRMHTDEKSFSCSVCEKAFTQKYNLRAHMHSHKKGKPFSCSKGSSQKTHENPQR